MSIGDCVRLLIMATLAAVPLGGANAQGKVTVLYDAFGPPSSLKLDWGFSALVEYNGKRILFDTGNNAKNFQHNVSELKVDLAKLDAVVLSHRHSDHTGGLSHVLKVNPNVKIYAPQDPAVVIPRVPFAFLKKEPGLPASMSYFRDGTGGEPSTGTPWTEAQFTVIDKTTEIFPGFFLFSTVSSKKGTLEMPELSLGVKTPQGLAVIVGCSHPGVENILASAAAIEPQLYTVTGGFHLVLTGLEEVERISKLLDETLKIKRVAPGHCTSELGFKVLMTRFKDRFDQAGAGSQIALP